MLASAVLIAIIPIKVYSSNCGGIIQKGMGLSDFGSHLKDEMGLRIVAGEWPGAADLPPFLGKAAAYRLCACGGVSFVAVEIGREASLPEREWLGRSRASVPDPHPTCAWAGNTRSSPCRADHAPRRRERQGPLATCRRAPGPGPGPSAPGGPLSTSPRGRSRTCS